MINLHQCFLALDSALSQALKEGQQLIARSVTTLTPMERLGLGQCSFFEFKIGMEINLGRFDRFMSQPQGDD